MKTIYKYNLQFETHIELQLPVNAKILSVQVQNGSLCLWALVDPDLNSETRVFDVIGTGHTIRNRESAIINNLYKHLSTVQIGQLVFHVFEVTTPF